MRRIRIINRKTKDKVFSLNKGFTLVELLIVASILGMVALAVLSSFDAGFRTFAHIQTFGGTQADVLLAMERFERDVKNAFRLSEITFDGGTKEISFPTVVTRLDEEDNERVSLGKITYRFDSSQKAFVVKEEGYAGSVAGEGSGETSSEILAYIEDLNFNYYFYRKEMEGDQERVDYGWKAVWNGEEEGIPKGIKIEVVFTSGSRENSLSRTVFIPVGGETVVVSDGSEQGGEGGQGGDV